ncbi:MAG: vWA domain-containing protein [Gammaproteobacteria bacterium]|nr:vWA domain-containing protein [Gammaproteobacteria bacterium]
MTIFTRPLALFLLLLMQFNLSANAAGVQSQTSMQQLDDQIDIRILVDVSGSMKQTDPLNLRVPALQVLTQLLPEQAHAGVWEFADSASLVVPHGAIDDQWRELALAAAQNIRSDGQYTDIGGALQAAAFGQQERASRRNLHVILLTDGMVDVAKNEVVNIRARNELLQHITQEYVDAGALVHAIALSHAADEKTLSDIARRTDGLFAVAENANQLLDIFLRALDNSVLTQQAPVAADRQSFVVNSDVQSITVVVAKKGDQGVALQSPDGEVISATEANQQIAWQESSTHDVVTVQEPEQGTWAVTSGAAEVTRVNVQGQLKMDLRVPSTNIYLGQPTFLEVTLNDAQGPLADVELLSQFTLQLSLENEQNQVQWQQQMPMSAPALVVDMPAQQELGLYRLRARLVHADKVQEVERSLRVHPPVEYQITQQKVGQMLQYEVSVTPLFKQLDLDASYVTVTGQRGDATGLQKSIALKVDKWQGSWQETEALSALALRLEGVTLQGEPVTYSVPVAQVNVLTPKQVAQQQQAQSVAVEDLPEAKVIEVQAEQASPTQEAPIEVSEEQPTEAMQALMNEPEAAPEAAPEVAPEVALEVTSAANIQSPVAAVPEVTVEVEPAETQVDNRLALLGILLLVLVVSMIWARIKGPVQNKSKVKPVPNKPA